MSSLLSFHCHQPVVHQGNPLAERKTRWAVLLTLIMMVAEIGGGWFYNSMALLADGWHMSSHALALGLSVVAYRAARHFARDHRFSFGTWKIEVLGGFSSALLLVGVTLAFTKVGHQFGAALRIALVKCVVHPLVLAALGWSLGLSGMPLAVMIVAAALPVGANVFLFTQRYEVAQEEVTASIAVSTALALVTVPAVILAVAGL